MSKEWNNPSDFLSAGLYASQNRKAIFRSLLTHEGLDRGFCPTEYEEAADLSFKREKMPVYESREQCYSSSSYTIDETMDLSTKWRPHITTSDRRNSSLSLSFSSVMPGSSDLRERTQDGRSWNRSLGYIKMQPRKRLRLTENNLSVTTNSSVDECYARINGHINGYESDSKNDDEPMELPPCPQEKIWDAEELREKQRMFKEIRDELRSEEMKLVLLRKLHQSQLIKENLFSPATVAASVANKMVPTMNRATAGPPPLMRSGMIAPPGNKLLNQQLPHQSSVLNTSQMLSQGNNVPPPLVPQRGISTSSSLSSLSSNMMAGMLRTGHTSTTRNLTPPPNQSIAHTLQNITATNNHHQTSTQVVPPLCSSPQSSVLTSDRVDNQSPAQRQAAAKLALRKQLEKTLLQIPPPKPPPPEMHFIPNANNQEFICLLGLEKIVDCLTEDPNISRPPPEPFECVQCGTDFSPVWKWDTGGGSRLPKPAVICETCVTSNIKKALKAEHTNRLKTAFVKALQQEQEIEQRMAQAMPSPPPPISASPTPTPSSTPTPVIVSSTASTIPTPPAPQSPAPPPSHHSIMSKIGNSSSQSGVTSSAPLLQHLPKLSAAHQSLLQAQAQQLQQFAQSLPQPQPAHMLPFAPLLAAQAYSYQLLGKSPVTSAELQRQYLLDMIPPRSLPQSSLNWKTSL